MKENQTSRRQFIRQATCGVGVGSLGLSGLPTCVRADKQQPDNRPVLEDETLPTFHKICPEHVDLLLRRSCERHEHIRLSLKEEGARPVTVGAYQMRNRCGGAEGKESNLGRMIRAISESGKQGVQMLAFPEMCMPGYFTPISGTPVEAAADNHALADVVGGSRYLERLQDAARREKMVLAFGFCEKQGDTFYNSIGLIDSDGAWLGTRRKNPLYPYPYETGSFAEPDPSKRSAVFRTRYATVGISNCFDGEFPESVRQMRLDGAEVLLWCNAALGNCVLGTSNRINHSGAHALANHMWVVCCNCVAPNASGTSLIVGPSGEHLVLLPPDREALAVTTINLALSANWNVWRSRLGPQWKDRI